MPLAQAPKRGDEEHGRNGYVAEEEHKTKPKPSGG